MDGWMRNARALVLPAIALGAWTGSAQAIFHLIDVNEVFTNTDGTLQFVELIAFADLQTEIQLTNVRAANADSSMSQVVFDFITPFPILDNGETILLATAGFAAAAGFAPDFVIPDGRIFLGHGRVAFDEDDGPDVDAVAYGHYTGPNTGFGTPASPLPNNGFLSLTRTGSGNDNATNFAVMPNSPRRNDGISGQIPAPAGIDPGISPPAAALVVGPNPFTAKTRAALGLTRGGRVRLEVFASNGRLVRQLWNGDAPSGVQFVEWDGRNTAGRPVAAGTYYLRLNAADVDEVAKLTIVR